MIHTDTNRAQSVSQPEAMFTSRRTPVNAIGEVDGFITAEPTPKPESRRGWRRRRIRRGKS